MSASLLSRLSALAEEEVLQESTKQPKVYGQRPTVMPAAQVSRSPSETPPFGFGDDSPSPHRQLKHDANPTDDAASAGSVSPSVAGSKLDGSSASRAGAASAQFRLRVQHQREVRRLFSEHINELMKREGIARCDLEHQAIERTLVTMHHAFMRERQIFVAHSQSKTSYIEMLSRHQLELECADHFEGLFRFVDARLLPVKIEALQIQCLQVQCFIWLQQGLERAELYDRIGNAVEAANEWQRSISHQGRWAVCLCQLAVATLETRTLPSLIAGRRLSAADVALVRAQWGKLAHERKANELRRQRDAACVAAMLDDLQLHSGAERVRLQWEEEEAAAALLQTRMLMTRARRQGQ